MVLPNFHAADETSLRSAAQLKPGTLGGRDMSQRFQDLGASVYSFDREFLVRCPRCDRRADVRVSEIDARLTCTHCGVSRSRTNRFYSVSVDATDWYFKLPLWLQAPCCGHVLWARNLEHLAFLEEFVEAKLRERPNHAGGYRNKLLVSRLPLWIKSARNRDAVMAALAKLRSLSA